jgi:hypothetical protein
MDLSGQVLEGPVEPGAHESVPAYLEPIGVDAPAAVESDVSAQDQIAAGQERAAVEEESTLTCPRLSSEPMSSVPPWR